MGMAFCQMEAILVSVCSDMHGSCFSFCTNVNQLWVKYNVKLYLEKPNLKLVIHKIRTTLKISEKFALKKRKVSHVQGICGKSEGSINEGSISL